MITERVKTSTLAVTQEQHPGSAMPAQASAAADSVPDSTAKKESLLNDNLQALVKARNDYVNNYIQDGPEIPAALVRLKWQNRREIYPLMMQEEIYGLVLWQIMQRYPALREQITAMLEKRYQQIKQQEAATLVMTRKLAEGNYQPPALYLD